MYPDRRQAIVTQLWPPYWDYRPERGVSCAAGTYLDYICIKLPFVSATQEG